jgi:hypothetical protein
LVFNTYFEKETSYRGLAMDVECNPQAYYEASEDATSFYIKEQHDWQMSISFCEDNPYTFLLYTFEKENDMKCVRETNKEIEGIIYPFILEVEDLSGQRRIDRFIKVDACGITEFHDRSTGLTWTQKIK